MNDDVLIEKLRALPPELPVPADRLAGVRRRVVRRRRGRAGAVVAAVLVAVGVAGVLQARSERVFPDRPGALACPEKPADGPPATEGILLPELDPEPPTVDTGGHLVPRETPLSVLVCTYTGSTTDPERNRQTWSLRAQPITGGLDDMARDLWWFPRNVPGSRRACVGPAKHPGVHHLVGLRYPGGTVWIAAPVDVQSCGVGAVNGDFASYRDLDDQLERSLPTGRWQPSSDGRSGAGLSPCRAGPAPGRFGEDEKLVPGTPVEVQVCQDMNPDDDGPHTYRTVTTRTGVAALAAKFNAAKTTPLFIGCSGAGYPGPHYDVTFRYAEGPPVVIGATFSCGLPLTGGALSGEYPQQSGLGVDLAELIEAG